MTNKDQLEQTGEGKEVVALLAEHFPADQFQHALTLIEQRYTEDQTVWDADLNRESKWPFLKINEARRLLVFFASPSHLATIKAELEQRAAETALRQPVAAAERVLAAAKPKAKRKTIAKAREMNPAIMLFFIGITGVEARLFLGLETICLPKSNPFPTCQCKLFPQPPKRWVRQRRTIHHLRPPRRLRSQCCRRLF